MFNIISDLLDSQIRILEAKGAWLLVPLFGIQAYIYAWFANIHGVSDVFDLIKNIVLSIIGIAMGVMGVVNTYLSMKRRIKKYKEEDKDKDKAA